MATALIQPPPHFEPGTRPAHAWEEWRSSYELYEEACEYTTKSAGPRRALLLHVLGPAARKTYKGFAFPQPTAEQPRETSKDILDKFEELYKPYKNITHSSAIFNSIVQKQNQTIDELVSELKVVAIDCDYGEKQDRLIGDHIIFGIRDSALRERLLREPSLSLDKIINFCKSAEISKEQAKILQPTVVTTDATINSLQQQRRRCHVSCEYSKQRKGSAPKTTNRSVKPPANPRQQRRCSRCDTTHPPRSCPAYGSNCETCGTFGHFARVCNKQWQYKDRRVSVLDHQELDEDSDDSLYLSELTIDSLEKTSKWSHKLKVNNNDVIFKIDTGSDVNIISIKAMSNWSRKPRIEPTTTKIKTYSGQILQVLGKCELKCTAAKSVACTFFVVAEDFLPILSADTSEELCLIQRATPTNIVAALETPKLQELHDQTASDPVLQLVLTYIRKGWPRTKTIKNYEVRAFAKCAEELHVVDNLLCRGQRLVIPRVAQSSVLASLHIAHRGMVATKSKARQSVYWPSINTDIEEMIRTCDICQKLQNNNPHEPLEDRTLTNRPWQSVALDFFHLNNNTYLLAVDYFSKYIEVQPMKSTTARCVITAIKAMVARFGLPEELITDNGPPFDSMEFTNFLRHWDIVHNPTAPYNPRSNGQVERTVQTLKKSLQKASQEGNDLYTVLMDYRNTPANGLRSPAEIFLGRRIRTLIPTLPSNFKPNYDIKDTLSRLKTLQKQQHKHGDEHTRSLNPLKVDQQVWFAHNKGWEPGIIVQVGPQKRSYVIKAVNGSKVRRNRFHIKVRHTKQPTSTVDKSDTMVPESPENYYNVPAPSEQVLQQRIIPKVTIPDSVLVTSSGRRVIKPARYLN